MLRALGRCRAFNLLLGFGGLLSFGHWVFFGTGGYVCAYAAKSWGLTPQSCAIFLGTIAAAALGTLVGALAIRRQGIYFAMITLAVAQMMYFFYLQTPFTHGEDGIQAVPRGRLFGFIGLTNPYAMYYTVLAIFLLAFLFIYRVIHSPFRPGAEGRPRNGAARSWLTDRRSLQAHCVRAVGRAGRPPRVTKAIVFRLASLTDVHWTMSAKWC